MVDEKHYKDLVVIYFNAYLHNKSIKMLSLYYHQLMGKIKKYKGKIFDGSWLYARRFKEIIGIKEFDNAKILIDKHDKLPDNIACCDINEMCYKR